MTFLVVLTCFLLGLAALPGGLTSEHVSAREGMRDTESHSAVLHRVRRDLQQEFEWFTQPNQPWCYCGNENWLSTIIKVNLEESLKCIRESKINLTGLEAKDVSSAITIAGQASRCAYDCIFRKLHLIDSEGNLKKLEVKNLFMDKVFLSGVMRDIGLTVVTRCLDTGTTNTLTLKAILFHGKGAPCGKEAKTFITCMLLEMVQECPEDLKRNDVEQCRDVYRNYELARLKSQLG